MDQNHERSMTNEENKKKDQLADMNWWRLPKRFKMQKEFEEDIEKWILVSMEFLYSVLHFFAY